MQTGREWDAAVRIEVKYLSRQGYSPIGREWDAAVRTEVK